MSTEATTQVLDTSVDTAGVSTVTATRTVAAPRQGTIYNPTTFAAGVPVWFHRRQDGQYLALFKQRWYAATAVYNAGPQSFSAHTVDTTPHYLVINPTTGHTEGPFLLAGMDTLDAAVSRGDYLFLIGTKGGVGWVQHYVVTRTGGLQLQGQEATPLSLHLGVYADGFYLNIFGDDGTGKLAQARKNWGRIGTNSDPNMQWSYQGAKGWYTSVDDTLPLPTDSGTIPAGGPVSVAKFRDRYYLAVTEHIAGAYASHVYTTRAVDADWIPVGSDVIPLGADAVYLGGGAYLQPQLVANKALVPDGANTGFPYVTSVKVVTGSDQAILTTWGILTV